MIVSLYEYLLSRYIYTFGHWSAGVVLDFPRSHCVYASRVFFGSTTDEGLLLLKISEHRYQLVDALLHIKPLWHHHTSKHFLEEFLDDLQGVRCVIRATPY